LIKCEDILARQTNNVLKILDDNVEQAQKLCKKLVLQTKVEEDHFSNTSKF